MLHLTQGNKLLPLPLGSDAMRLGHSLAARRSPEPLPFLASSFIKILRSRGPEVVHSLPPLLSAFSFFSLVFRLSADLF
ncbi:hypothetical protein A4R35_07215 [Thermogemmatispora tikiterensis]|uniref:Uncharacterized protein n=1 Tax=Thermogemmatispora tikiterensis TaxID=1825093 RepID=A0A328VHT1_9CHLR|nr:hypothetical protein A4R35_07215 [Thermogemmatispora tikiterensis]